MGDGFGGIPVVALLAVVTVTARGEVTAFEADPAGFTTGQLVQLHVEPAPASVAVALAGCNQRITSFS